MRTSWMGLVVVALLFAVSSVAFAQGAPAGRGASAKPSPPAADPKDLSGLWNGINPNNPFMDPKDVPMTPKAADYYKHQQQPFVNGPEMTDTVFHCEPSSVPRNYFNTHTIEIEQTPTKVIQLFEAWRNFRIFYTDGRKMPDHPEGTWYGDSIAHWDGNTLVVDTGNFNGRSWIDQFGHPTSDQMTLTEKFVRVDQDHLRDDIVITDPVMYTKSWGGPKNYQLRNDWQIEDYLCSPKDVQELEDNVTNPANAGDPLHLKDKK